MNIALPDTSGHLTNYNMIGVPIPEIGLGRNPTRTVFSAAHVVADPMTKQHPSGSATVDWASTMAFRRYLDGLGLGIAEAMDTAQRGMGLEWEGALELIRQTRTELPDALVFNGCGTDHLNPADARSLDDIERAYLQQIEAVQKLGGRIILMASRALAHVGRSVDDYHKVYGRVLQACDQPVILHWLGDMFDPALRGYWGSQDIDTAMATCLEIINENAPKVDGIKISLLDKQKEIIMRRRLPEGVKMYTGDDFNYPELIQGDPQGYSHALLGIFDPIAPAAAFAIGRLGDDDLKAYRATLDPTVPLSRLIFCAPTQYYKTGVVFLAWLNGFQNHFIMLGGAQSMRPLPYFVEIFKYADKCGLLRQPELAASRMRQFLAIYGL